MKIVSKFGGVVAAVLVFLASAVPVLAATPVLSLSNISGDTVRLTVTNADSNSGIELVYTLTGTSLPTRIGNFGVTDGAGYYSALVSSSGYGFGSGAQVYVVVNGRQSNTVNGTGSGGTVGTVSLSQSSAYVNAGQNVSVNVYYTGNFSGVSVTGNTNPSAISASLNGGQLVLTGHNAGLSTVTVCGNNSGTCASITVTVGGSSGGIISFSSNNPSVVVGQNLNVYIYSTNSGAGSFYISNQTNNNVVNASISGNNLTLYGREQGSSNITVCQYNTSACATVYVSVTGSSSAGISFSPSFVTINTGQSTTVSVSGGNSSSGYNISSISNNGVVTAGVSGNIVTIFGQSQGSSTITVCAIAGGQCGNFSVNVNGSGSSGGLFFSGTSLPVATIGQYYGTQLSAYGGTAPYVYTLQSGTLPAGLSLSTSGQVFGTPQSSSQSQFSVRASDYFGRSAMANFTLAPQCGSNGCVLGLSSYRNGTLIAENGTIYIVYKNTKSGFASRSVFEGLGFRLANVVAGNFNVTDSGYVISNASAAHPWGSWVKSGQTVYFVHDQGLIPVPSLSVFYANGGEDRLVVPTNVYDLYRPQLSMMSADDSRLR